MPLSFPVTHNEDGCLNQHSCHYDMNAAAEAENEEEWFNESLDDVSGGPVLLGAWGVVWWVGCVRGKHDRAGFHSPS